MTTNMLMGGGRVNLHRMSAWDIVGSAWSGIASSWWIDAGLSVAVLALAMVGARLSSRWGARQERGVGRLFGAWLVVFVVVGVGAAVWVLLAYVLPLAVAAVVSVFLVLVHPEGALMGLLLLLAAGPVGGLLTVVYAWVINK